MISPRYLPVLQMARKNPPKGALVEQKGYSGKRGAPVGPRSTAMPTLKLFHKLKCLLKSNLMFVVVGYFSGVLEVC